MTANLAAKLGGGVGGWAKFWPSDLGTAMSRAELSRGPLNQTLDSLALFCQKRLPRIAILAALTQNLSRELIHQVINHLSHVERQLLLDSVEDGELLPFVVLHSLIRDCAGQFRLGVFTLCADLKELVWLTAGIQIPLPRRQTGCHQRYHRRYGHASTRYAKSISRLASVGWPFVSRTSCFNSSAISASRLCSSNCDSEYAASASLQRSTALPVHPVEVISPTSTTILDGLYSCCPRVLSAQRLWRSRS